jgi:hypothetical protein
VVIVAGQVDVMDVVALRNEISRVVEETDLLRVVVDVSCARLGPRGVATLVDEKALLVRRGGDLRVVCGTTCGWGLSLFEHHDTVESALRSFDA